MDLQGVFAIDKILFACLPQQPGILFKGKKIQISVDSVNWETIYDEHITGDKPEISEGHTILLN